MDDRSRDDSGRWAREIERRLQALEGWRGDVTRELATHETLVTRAAGDLTDVRDQLNKVDDKIAGNSKWLIGLFITVVVANGLLAWLVKGAH